MEVAEFLRVIPGGSDPWVAVINGKKYVYPAGTEQYVPDEVAVLIDAQMRHEQPKYPPAQVGGAGEMVVHVTAVAAMDVEAEPQLVADKTFAEISEAFAADRNVRCVFLAEGNFYFANPSAFIPNSVASFGSYFYGGGNTNKHISIEINANGSVNCVMS